MKLHHRLRYPLQSLFISITMSSVLSLVFNLLSKTPASEFFISWLESFVVGVAVGFPISRLIVPKIIHMCDRWQDEPSEKE